MPRSLALSCLVAAIAAIAQVNVAQAGETPPPRRLPENPEARPITVEMQGTLRRNTEAKEGEPEYYLLDGQGRVACFVEPQAGVPAAKYVGRRVKLTGSKSTAVDQRTVVFAAQAIQSAVKDDVALAGAVENDEEPPVDEAAYQEELPAPMELHSPGKPYYESPAETMEDGIVGGEVFDDNCNVCNGWGCSVCGRRQSCLSGFYVRPEYLYWWTDGLYSPALITTSPDGAPRDDAGVIGQPGTTVLFGQESLNNEGRSGFRINLGYWWDPGHCHGVEADYWFLADDDDDFRASSNGSPILARPYFDLLGGIETSELIAFPNVIRGSVLVDTETAVHGAGLRKRWNICGVTDCDPCWGCGWRLDVTGGYRYMRLRDRIAVTEDLVSLDTATPGSFVVFDEFQTENTFNGGEIGALYERRRGRWSWEMLGRLALGNTRSRVEIDGFTDITPPGGATTRNVGGLLAQRTNIGVYERNNFAVVPELGATLGLQMTSVWRLTFGYSFIYWSNVVRAGQQIDRDINENLLPPEAVPFTGAERPRFAFNDTDFWAQGISLGLDARW